MINKEGFLRPGLALFGDNVYVNSPFMCVPFRKVAGGTPEDAFNFFQLQVRINIECAFGILVHCFGILRKPIPMSIDIKKTTRLVLALCKLHNFCIDQTDSGLEHAHKVDVPNLMRSGGIYCPRVDQGGSVTWTYGFAVNSKDRLDTLLDGSKHIDNHTREDRHRYRWRSHLPKDFIFRQVRSNRYTRPPRSSLHQRDPTDLKKHVLFLLR